MSNKKSSPKGKKAEMLDVELIQPIEKVVTPAQKDTVNLKEFRQNSELSFPKANYRLLFIGLGINILGYILMIGGAATELDQFDAATLFSNTRITLAPLFIVSGFVVIAYAIMRKPKTEAAEAESEASI